MKRQISIALIRMSVFLAATFCSIESATAGSVELAPDWNAGYRAIISYGVAMRAEAEDSRLIAGPNDPSTNLPTTINGDDGDRNFNRGSLIYNRLTTFGEMSLKHDNYGAYIGGSAFYDAAYLGSNDNDSPGTVNKTGRNNEFTRDAKRFDGHRVRLLDAYLSGRWDLPYEQTLDVRIGRQVVSWGQSVFFLGISAAQGPADATKANIPGVELKEILLPSNQVSFQYIVNQELSVLGYYKFEFKESELSPVGEYFSSTDAVGPGATFIYGAANPLYTAFSPIVPGTPKNLIVPRGPDIKPGSSGQWGLGASYQITPQTELSLYYLRYHENIPTVKLNVGPLVLVPSVVNPSPQLVNAVSPIFSALGVPQSLVPGLLTQGITTETIGQRTPSSYQVKYFDGVTLLGAGLSTTVGGMQVSGEYSYRRGASTFVQGEFPTFTRSNVSQALASILYVGNPTAFWDTLTVLAETGCVYLHHVDAVDGSTQLLSSKESYAFSALISPEYKNVFSGWDLKLNGTVSQLFKGAPAMTGAFGGLAGKNDRRAGIGATFVRMQSLELGLSYAWFLGSANLHDRPLADRDYVAGSIKYSF